MEFPLVDGSGSMENSTTLTADHADIVSGCREWRWRDARNQVDSSRQKTSMLSSNGDGNEERKYDGNGYQYISTQGVCKRTASLTFSCEDQDQDIHENDEEEKKAKSLPMISYSVSSRSHDADVEEVKSIRRDEYSPTAADLCKDVKSFECSEISKHPLRILIVDDSKSIRKLFARALTSQGHSCDVVCDGQECVNVFEKAKAVRESPSVCPYDLVLIDSEMPVMNGPTAVQIIRSMGYRELIMIGVTGNVMEEDVNIFMNHGVDAVLGKPLLMKTLWEEYQRIAIQKRHGVGSSVSGVGLEYL